MSETQWATAQALRRVAFQLAALTFEAKLARLMILVKAGFRPDQPRVPAGDPHGGRWTDGAIPINSRGPRAGAPRRVAGRWQNITPDQEVRLAVSFADMQAMLRAVRRIDGRWKPTPQAHETVEGEIAANTAVAREARIRLYHLTKSPPGAGPFAAEWIPSPLNRRLNRQEQLKLDRIGRANGCHWCGTKDPKTRSGHYIGDHQHPRAFGKPTRIYPHCSACSRSQGGIVKSQMDRR